MSNEYKDWINDLSAEEKIHYDLCIKYPFLVPRDIFTGEFVTVEEWFKEVENI